MHIIIIIIIIIVLCLFIFYIYKKKEEYDDKAANKILAQLKENSVEDVDKQFLEYNKDNIYMVKSPQKKENYDNLEQENFRGWRGRGWGRRGWGGRWGYPYGGHYSYPYDAWLPDDLYSRLNYWSPGFYTTSGWSYWLRPGIAINQKYPRSRWVRNNGVYYYILN